MGDAILLAAAPMFEIMHENCTLVPAVMVTDILNDTENGILTLSIKEVEMFDYIDELDCNITNGTLYDSGIDVGEIKKIKDLANYFGNVTEEYDENGTLTEMRFKNVSYTELKSVCYNITENGTIINEIPTINGLCDGLSSVDYFGQQYGVDTDIFFEPDDDGEINRRRLRCCRRLRRFFKKE